MLVLKLSGEETLLYCLVKDIASSLSKGYAFAEYADGTLTDQVDR